MKTRKKQKVIIGTLCAIIVGMAMGYAALSQILTINGTSKINGDFKIEITKIEESMMSDATTITKNVVGSTTANFTVDLKKPGSIASYDVTVENKGTVNAILKSIEGVDESDLKEPVDITYFVWGVEEGDSLNAGEQRIFHVDVEWKVSSTSVPTTTKSLTLKLNYEQNTGSDIVTPVEEFFEIDETGTITDYTGTNKAIIIPSTIHGTTVTSIGKDAFKDKKLTHVVIPDSVTSIGQNAFSSNKITSVVIPDSVTSIGGYAFYGNPLTNVTLSNNITEISDALFFGAQLTSIVIPASVTRIGEKVFWGSRLTSITIPNNVTEIGKNAFWNNQLTSVVIPENVTSIGENAFMDNSNLITIVNKTGRPYDWNNILGLGTGTPAITGTYGPVTVTTE